MSHVQVTISSRRLSEVPINRLIFGNFIELGLGRQVSGMWSEMLYNRTFRAQTPLSKHVWGWLGFSPELYGPGAPFWHSGYEENDWEPIGDGTLFERTHGFEPWKGNDSLGVRGQGLPGGAGARQRGLWLREGARYRFSFFGGFQGRKTGVETRAVTVSVLPEESTETATPIALRRFDIQACQAEHEMELLSPRSGRARLEIKFDWAGTLHVSWCSMVPLETRLGWRADVVKLLERVRPTALRFPGGCFASFYDWRDGVGPVANRRVRESYFWGRIEENDVGIDELLELCGMVGAEPQICVNMMTGEPRLAAELVAHCREKKAGGVRLWEMDNEAGRKWSALQYAAEVKRFAREMREVDPGITIMMEYYSWGIEWLERMLEVAGPVVDVVIHRDADPPFIQKALGILRRYNEKHGTAVKQANTEWLPSFHAPEPFDDPEIPRTFDWEPSGNDYRKVLSFRQVRWFYALNQAVALLDYLSYGGEFALANFNNCANTWGGNVIQAAKEAAWLSPCGRVFEFFRDDVSAYPLDTRLRGHLDAYVSAQACETREGGAVLYLVNRGRAPVTLELKPPVGLRPSSGRAIWAPDRLSTTTATEDPVQVETLDPAGDLTLRPLSVTGVRLEP